MRIKEIWALLAAVIVGSLLLPGANSLAEKSSTYDPRNFSGDWDRITPVVTYGTVPGSRRSPVNLPLPDEGVMTDAPFTPTGKALYEANKPGYGHRAGMERNDPLGRCEPLGIPRNLNVEIIVPHATLEMVQLPNRIIQFFEYHHHWREIWMDGRKLPDMEVYEPKWNGYSIGHFEGDTLVVESIGFDDRAWLDKYGYPHSEDMHLVERYRRIDAETLELTMTLTDPAVYSEPWQGNRKLYRLNRARAKEWDEQVYCVPAEEFLFQDLMGTGNRIQ